MEAMVFCAAVRLLGEGIKKVREAQITLSYGVSFGSRLRAEAFGVSHSPYTPGCCSLRHLQSAVSKPDLRFRLQAELASAGWQGQRGQQDQTDPCC